MESTSNRGTYNLALMLQEVLTAVVRLRANRQTVSDAESFRAQIVANLRHVEQEGRQRGYSEQEMKLAIFACVAFLDESVLNSRNPVFSSWASKPLQEELFGGHMAGETFFANAHNLLSAPDSANVADVLEVYQLCLLLAYQGRYTLGNQGELQAIKQNIADKIHRIRGDRAFAPDWAPVPGTTPRVRRDSVLHWLLYTAAACALIAVLCFASFSFSLNSGVTSVRDLAHRASAARQ